MGQKAVYNPTIRHVHVMTIQQC